MHSKMNYFLYMTGVKWESAVRSLASGEVRDDKQDDDFDQMFVHKNSRNLFAMVMQNLSQKPRVCL